MTEPIRLQKFISSTGRASRREAERLMTAGRVTVNGETVSELGTRIDPVGDVVAVDGEVLSVPEPVWIAYHKPAGVLTTRSDPHGGETIYDRLPADFAGLRYVGRLDRDTEGLLLLTNQGDAAHRLQHPSGAWEREYVAEVEGRFGDAEADRLRRGVELEDGPAVPARVEVVASESGRSTVMLVLTEGRKREVRRMLAAVGHPVTELRRVRFGSIELGDLDRGSWRELTSEEVEALSTPDDAA